MLNDKTVLHPGNTASLTGSLQEIMTATNPGMFDRREYYKEKGVYYELRATTLQITSSRTNPVKDLLYRLRNFAARQGKRHCFSNDPRRQVVT